jgi:hypothetical protein
MNIVYVYYDHPQDRLSFEWQCAIPAKAINRTQRHSAHLLSLRDFINNTSQAQLLCETADVIIIHRRIIGAVLSTVQKWKAYDKKILLNLDTPVNTLTKEMPSYDFWYNGISACHNGDCIFGDEPLDPKPIEQLAWSLRLVDGVITPSERLSDDIGESIRCTYIPSFLDTDQYLKQTAAIHEGIVIGLGGDGNHFPGIKNSGVLQALGQVVQKRDQVQIVVFGGDQRIYDHLPVSSHHKYLWPTIEQADWPRYLSRLDIGLAPLSGDFDQRSGSARLLEYMVMKIPWIGSESSVYRKFSQYGWLVPNSAEAWEKVILEMVDHIQDYRVEAAAEPYLYALSNDIDENINTILMAYENMGL